MNGRMMPGLLLGLCLAAPALSAEEAAEWNTVVLERTPREALQPSVVLSTDELIKRHQLDVRTAIAVHDLLRAQDAKRSALRAEADPRQRHDRTEAWLTETGDLLATKLRGAPLQAVRKRIDEKYRAEVSREARRAQAERPAESAR